MILPRRHFLKVAAAGAGMMWATPHMALAAAATDRRFIFLIQRGAADGLHTVIPYGDPDYARLRGPLAIDPAHAIKLDGHFALHSNLIEAGKMYGAGQALFVHAAASPYRDRSHFDGQNVLETGGTQAYAVADGWLNRLVTMLPKRKDDAIAFAVTLPPALRGPAEVASYAPSGLPEPSDDLLARVGHMYQGDGQLHALWDAAMTTRGMAAGQNVGQDAAKLGKLAATFLARPDGPRIAMLETGNWDTHTSQMARMNIQFKALDAMLAALRDGLGPVWNDTIVLVATEFGRTAAANGTSGTDHGTGSVVMLFGGAIKGGRVIADWPGLSQASLYQARDLKPTIGLDSVIAAAAGETFGIDPAQVTRTLFPTVPASKPLEGLVRV